MARPKVLVSACLLGERVRYHGGDAAVDHPLLDRWVAEGRVVSSCPEVAGGLSAPRPPAEIAGPGAGDAVRHGSARVVTDAGVDVTEVFILGARAAVDAARALNVRAAILKDGSPSCATTVLHDGSFTGRKTIGLGVTAASLQAAGIRVFNERQIDEAAAYLDGIEREEGP